MSTPTPRSEDSGRGRLWVVAAGVALAVLGLLAWFLQAPTAGVTTASPGGDATSAARRGDEAPAAVRAPRLPGAPRRVLIPALRVDAPVLPVRAPGGTLVPPSNPRQLGWWAGGARPGAARGSALVTGHTVHTGGGALDDLETLQRGDVVTVRTDRGFVRYAVRRVAVHSKGSVADHAERLFSQQVPGRLVLITCEDWDGQRYLSNVVVVATPVEQRHR
ncbi:class F sortase [Nocardioides sp. MAHUQ-72]|uniref:class F sortase n=1 Tax=unclassified Nocardioides TaxID=2615069 RepID=UPI00360C8A49